jgi:hypothetical protein
MAFEAADAFFAVVEDGAAAGFPLDCAEGFACESMSHATNAPPVVTQIKPIPTIQGQS